MLAEPFLELKELPHSSTVPEVVLHDGKAWRLIDTLEFVARDSAEHHAVGVSGSHQTYPLGRLNRYRDRGKVADRGLGRVGGTLSYQVLGVTPGQPLLLVRRVDLCRGHASLEVRVDGKSAGTIAAAPTDVEYRWCNESLLIAEALVTRSPLPVEQVVAPDEHDDTYRIWFFQPAPT